MHCRDLIRDEFARLGKQVDDTVIEELSEHAAAAFEAARAEGASTDKAEADVRALIAQWCANTNGPRRIERTPLLEAAPSSRSPVAGLGLDVRNAFRLIRRQPGMAAVSVLMIALAIGVTTTLFSIVNGVLLRPLPWKHADRLVRVHENRAGMHAETDWAHRLTNISLIAWSENPRTIEGVGGWREEELGLQGETAVERISTAKVTPSLFPLLGESPLFGAQFTAEDARSNNAVILSYGFWQERFGGAADVLGKPLALGGRSRIVVGVMRRGFEFPTAAVRLWTPYELGPHTVDTGSRTYHRVDNFDAIARLTPGVSPAQAAAEGSARLNAVTGEIRRLATDIFTSQGASIAVVPLLDWVVRDVRPALWILVAAGVLLFAAALGTVVNLQLAQALVRRRELAIRSAIGAGRGRLARQLFVETMTLSVIGGALGLALTLILLRIMPAVMPATFPRVDHIALGFDTRVFGLAGGLTMLVALTIGVLPSRMARRQHLVSALLEDGSAPTGQSFRTAAARSRGLIITAQVAIAAMLLVGGALLTRSFNALLAADLGYTSDNLLTARVEFFGAGLPEGSRAAFYNGLLDRIKARRDVEHAGFTDALPTVGRTWQIQVGLRPGDSASGASVVEAVYRLVSDDYFPAMGIRMTQGRGFTAQDTLSTDPVVLVNETFARRYLAGNALGVATYPALYQYRPNIPRWRIVGVVADVQHGTPVDPIHPEIYATTGQLDDYPTEYLAVRTGGDPHALVADLRAIVRDASKNASLDQVVTMEGRIRTNLARPRLYATLIGGFSAFAVLIAVIGLFGGLSYAVTQRTREIGVRSALGATPRQILGLVMKQGTIMTAIGVFAGLALAAASGRYLSAFLFGVAALDGATFAIVGAALFVVALVACAVPARRAAKIDAVTALRR